MNNLMMNGGVMMSKETQKQYRQLLMQRQQHAIEQLEMLVAIEEQEQYPIWVFGSFAKLNFRACSDLDAFFDIDQSPNEERKDCFAMEFEDLGIDVCLRPSEEFLEKIQKDFIKPVELIPLVKNFQDIDGVIQRLPIMTLNKVQQLIENTHRYTLPRVKEFEDAFFEERFADSPDLLKHFKNSIIQSKVSLVLRRIEKLLREYLLVNDHLLETDFLYEIGNEEFLPLLSKKTSQREPLLTQEEVQWLQEMDSFLKDDFSYDELEKLVALLLTLETNVLERLSDEKTT